MAVDDWQKRRIKPLRGGALARAVEALIRFTPVACLTLASAAVTARTPSTLRRGSDLVIVNGTIIDVDRHGHSTADRRNRFLVIRNGRFAKRRGLPLAGVAVLDARGKFIVPGLIDGFGALRSQAFADAYLYEGVTSVLVNRSPPSSDGEQRIATLTEGPRLLQAETFPDERKRLAAVMEAVAPPSSTTLRALTASAEVAPDQLLKLVRWGAARGLKVTGEFARTPYPQAVAAGASILLRNDHYLTALAPPGVARTLATSPTDPKAASIAIRAACDLNPADGVVARFAGLLRTAHVAMMPMLSIEATADDLGTPNPWRSQAAVFVRPQDLDDPVEPSTGARPYLVQHPDRVARLQECARNRQRLDHALHGYGVAYLAGSGSPAYGILPGEGLHQELKLLQQIGLSPREALSAATSGLADAFGWQDVGRIAAGCRGDVLVLDEDPRLEVGAVDAIHAVVQGGRIIDRAALLARARGAAAVPAVGAL